MTTEGESETDPKVLVVHDDRLDAIWALNVKAKGPSAEVVTWIVGKLEESGYNWTAIAVKTITIAIAIAIATSSYFCFTRLSNVYFKPMGSVL